MNIQEPFPLRREFCAANGVVIITAGTNAVTFGLLNPEDASLKVRLSKAYAGQVCSFEPLSQEDFNLRLSRLFAEDLPGDTSGAVESAEREGGL